jgi:hypothetical protein
MDLIEWLRARLVGFPTPEQGELLKAITDFALLWSFFEGTALGTEASPPRILQRVREWHRVLRFPIDEFAAKLEYFRNRYTLNGNLDLQYDMLRRLNDDQARLVQRVLERGTEDAVECASIVLLLVLRIRHNLFHGRKMVWGFDDQGENFQHATLALMSAWELERRAQAAGLAPMQMAP